MTDKVDVNFLSIIYEIIRSFEKDSHDVTQKISELRQRFEVCREQVNQLPGIDHSQAEQLQQIEILRQQMATQYRKFVRLLEMWPVDNSKVGRDLGQHIRNKVAETFREGDATRIPDIKACEQQYTALQQISADIYKNKYPVSFNDGVAASGLTYNECHLIMATDSLQILDRENRRWWQSKAKSEQKKRKLGKQSS